MKAIKQHDLTRSRFYLVRVSFIDLNNQILSC